MDGVLHPQKHRAPQTSKEHIRAGFYKRTNNSMFGKTMENLHKQVDVKLVRPTEVDKLRKLVAKPSFSRSVIFAEAGDLAAVYMHKSRLLLH